MLPMISLKQVVLFILGKWMIIGIGIAILLAYLFPNVARDEGIIKAQYSVNYGFVGLIFLISGLNMPTKALYENASNWRAHIIAQSLSFLVTSSIMFGIAEAIRIAHNPNINDLILAGIVICGVTPTTVASNVVMTKEAHGNDHLVLIEVTIGNLIGAFLSPALVQMYLSNSTGFSAANPASGSSISSLYGRVMQNLGCAVFAPLFVGQVIQNIFPKQVKYLFTKFKISKVGSFCLLILIWSAFSTSFHQKAFESISHACVIMVVFLNVGFYLFFTVLSGVLSRIPFDLVIPPLTDDSSKIHRFAYKFFVPFKQNRKNTVGLMLCGAAKTVALGIPLINSQYGQGSPLIGTVSLPLVLYQGEQIFIAQILIPLFRKWIDSEEEELAAKNNEVNDDDYDDEDLNSSTEPPPKDNLTDGSALKSQDIEETAVKYN